ncbi:MAG: tRNA (guanosine(37)-N1)-methyltransferase TrmD [Candidatus Caenarcaniphilales bacterium]|nr:tRNA (guanosine(37)-N1)-methyltransferase TrmD [Candidatus Caenarcaniphilales bacterium]
MRFDVLTLFPEIIKSYTNESIIGNALAESLIEMNSFNPRDYSLDKHKKVDATPYGGGAGMLLQIQPFLDCFLDLAKQSKTSLCNLKLEDYYPKGIESFVSPHLNDRDYEVIMFSPRGERLNQAMIKDFASKKQIVMLCGRYEGFDERLRNIVSKEVSLGDFVLTGGELPALTVIDAVTRVLPDVLGDDHSAIAESFNSALDILEISLDEFTKAEKSKLLSELEIYGVKDLNELGQTQLIEHPHFTRPADFRSYKVPEILKSGDHKRIALWRLKEAFRITYNDKANLM